MKLYRLIQELQLIQAAHPYESEIEVMLPDFGKGGLVPVEVVTSEVDLDGSYMVTLEGEN